eukprot:c7985_g1_i1 orf=1-609(-)
MDSTEKKLKAKMMRVFKKKKNTAPMKASASRESRLCRLQETLPPLQEARMPIENLAHLVQKCRLDKDRDQGLLLHAYMRKTGLDNHSILGNHLVSMLAEIGSLSEAQQVFDRLLYRNEQSWNSIIIGHIKCGKPQHALSLYQEMSKDHSIHLSTRTLVALLKACASIKDLMSGLKLHREVARLGLVEENLFIGSTLVDMYAKC